MLKQNVLKQNKRLFVFLAGVCLLFLALLVGFFSYLASHPQGLVFKSLAIFCLSFLAAGILLLGLGVLVMVLSILRGHASSPIGRFFFRTALSLYPFVLALGRFFHLNLDKIRASFIEVNNHLVRSYHLALAPSELMVLAPHCLQKKSCQIKISQNVNKCQVCGGCGIGGLLGLSREIGFNLAVATGGTLARKSIREYHPKAIIAIACERDLAGGILDVRPLPVLGILNQRPDGPCCNTVVSYDRVIEALGIFIQLGIRN